MLHHYDDNKFKKIIHEFILSSSNDKLFLHAIKNIDHEAATFQISFYQMNFILIQKDIIQTRKKGIVNIY